MVGMCVVVIIGAITWWIGQSKQAKIEELRQQQVLLEQQIANEEQRYEDLEEQKKYMKTKQYYEEVAKDKLGLIYEDEIIFRPSRD